MELRVHYCMSAVVGLKMKSDSWYGQHGTIAQTTSSMFMWYLQESFGCGILLGIDMDMTEFLRVSDTGANLLSIWPGCLHLHEKVTKKDEPDPLRKLLNVARISIRFFLYAIHRLILVIAFTLPIIVFRTIFFLFFDSIA